MLLALYFNLSVFLLQMIAVIAKNISFDGDLTIAVVKKVLLYNCKKNFSLCGRGRIELVLWL